METREYRFVDKTAWKERGAWDNEPDKVQWQDEATGMPCIARRSPNLGFWCGYVGVSEGHPHFGQNYNDVNVDVHGGLTFADFCNKEGDEATSICHVPGPGESDRVFWFGFDCGHAWDLSPAWDRKWIGEHETYRDLDYVRQQCANLARQLAAIAATS